MTFDLENRGIIVMQSNDGKEYYGFERKDFSPQHDAYFDGMREKYKTGKEFDMPELEAAIFEEAEPGYMRLGAQRKVVRFDEMHGVLIRCN